MKLLTTSVLLAGGLATAALAAPSQQGQLIFNDAAEAPVPATTRPDSHREPDFVDILESEAEAAFDQVKGDVSPFWPPVPTPTPGGGWVWSSCGQPDDVVEVKSIDVSPDPPVPGKNMTVKARGVVKRTIKVSTDPLIMLTQHPLTPSFISLRTATRHHPTRLGGLHRRRQRQDWRHPPLAPSIRHLRRGSQ